MSYFSYDDAPAVGTRVHVEFDGIVTAQNGEDYGLARTVRVRSEKSDFYHDICFNTLESAGGDLKRKDPALKKGEVWEADGERWFVYTQSTLTSNKGRTHNASTFFKTHPTAKRILSA